jgi:DNA polymerase III epsilon subunit-like protein
MRTNRFDGFCGACAVHVAAGDGNLTGRPGRWRTWCLACSPKPPPRADHDGWHHLPLASLDFETTGVDPHHDRVLSYALLEQPGSELSGLVNPGVPIPEGASAIHGITAEALLDAPGSAAGLVVVVEWVQSLIDRDIGLVVFNAAYDLTMLRAEAHRHRLAQPDWQRLMVVDPLVVDWSIERGGLGPRRLTDVATYYGVVLGNAHDAVCDARAARHVAVELAARHPDVGRLTLDELMHHQREWYAERAREWNDYAVRVGRDVDDPSGWPLAG